MRKIKVIIHVNTLERWSHALGNVKNLIADLGDTEYDIIMLANGESVHYYTHDFTAADFKSLENLSNQGVQFKACQNSLNGNRGSSFFCSSCTGRDYRTHSKTARRICLCKTVIGVT